MNVPRTMIVALALLAVAGVASAQETSDTVNSRRNRFRLQGGVIPGEGNSYPLANINYHHRFGEPGPGSVVMPSVEAGLNWIWPYADAGLTMGTEAFQFRVGGGAMYFYWYGADLIGYGTASATLIPLRGDWADLELEARVMVAGEGNPLAAVSLSLALH